MSGQPHRSRAHARLWGVVNVPVIVAPASVRNFAKAMGRKALRSARLVVGERQGKRVTYRLQNEHVGGIVEDTPQHAAELQEPT